MVILSSSDFHDLLGPPASSLGLACIGQSQQHLSYFNSKHYEVKSTSSRHGSALCIIDQGCVKYQLSPELQWFYS